ncbi:hypothetical protein FACS1894132_07390 [Clostridia bacterium]|nr:hypothetical protein FACS1894132_07390 [Clostridia bacterium]
MNPLVSVIIPVYNAEKYMRRTFDCILNQTLREIEIIAVDDGSTDLSLDILREYSDKDLRMKVLTQQNKTAGAARNAGLAIAKGEYLSFLDSDDLFELNMLETAYNSAKKFDADIVIFDADAISAFDGRLLAENYFSYRKNISLPSGVFSPSDVPEYTFVIGSGFPWDKIFRRDFIEKHSLKFQEIRKHNDMYFSYCAIAVAEKIHYIPKKMVHYNLDVPNQLSQISAVACDNFPYLTECEKILDFIETNGYDNLIQGFYDRACYGIIHALYGANKQDDINLKQLVIQRWINRLYKENKYYYYNADFLRNNEFFNPGFIKKFFEKPYLAVKPNYILPSLNLNTNDKIVLYGAGIKGIDFYLQILENMPFNIVAWADSNAEKLKKEGYPIISPNELLELNFDYILVAVLYQKIAEDIKSSLIKLGIPEKKIIWATAFT